MSHPRLRIVGSRNDHAKRFKGDISTLLASVLKIEPSLSPQQAMWRVQEKMLSNNPYLPPRDGKCLINELPAKVLAHIFRVGVEMQREGNDDEFEEEEEEEEEEGTQASFTAKGTIKDIVVGSDDDDSDWEDDSSVEAESYGEEEEEEEEEDPPCEILVSHVCRRWREIALDTPDLWSTIFIESPHQWDRYEIYLERAKTQPLELKIDLEGEGEGNLDPKESQDARDGATSHQDIKRIMDMVVPKTSQWQSILISTDYWRDARIVLEILHQIPAAPLLEALHFDCYDDLEDDVFKLKDPFYLPFHGNAPKLQSVYLWSIHIDWDGAVSMFKDLKELELGYHAKDVRPSWQAFSTYLKNSPQISRLELKASGPSFPSDISPSSEGGDSPLEVPSLRDLVLSRHEPSHALALIKKLHFPNLHFLSLCYEGADFTEIIKACSEPLPGVTNERSLFQTIESLKVQELGHAHDDAIDSMLEALRGLKFLSIDCSEEDVDNPGVARGIWNRLESSTKIAFESKKPKRKAAKKNAPSTTSAANLSTLHRQLILPNLQGIRIREIPGTRLRKWLSQRIEIGAPLKQLSVHPDDDVTESDELWFREHLEEFKYYADTEDENEEDDDDDDETEDEKEDEDDDDEDESDEGNKDVSIGGGRVGTRRPNARGRPRGAASSRVTTGLSNLD